MELLKQLNQREQLAIITVLHDINLAVRYSNRLALMRQGKLLAIGSVAETLTPEILHQVFDIDVTILDTPIGPQICPLVPPAHTSLKSISTIERLTKCPRTEIKRLIEHVNHAFDSLLEISLSNRNE